MKKQNYNRLLVSLTDRIMVWMDEMAETDGVTLPYTGNNTAAQMAVAAMTVLQAVDDLRETLLENGEISEEG